MARLSVACTFTLFVLFCLLSPASVAGGESCDDDEVSVSAISLLQMTLTLGSAAGRHRVLSGVHEVSTAGFKSTTVPYKEYAADKSEVTGLPDYLSQGQLLTYNPTNPKNSDMFVFLPGSWVGCNNYTQFLETVGTGMKTLCLPYDNIKSVFQLCGADSACWYKARMEAISGKFENIDGNNIIVRLRSALEYMKRKQGEDWAGFLSVTSHLNFERMRISGHSQGAGVAAMLAYQNRVARVVQFSGPCDPSDWPRAVHSNTPASRFFAMASSSDHMCDWENLQVPIWTMEGIVSTERPAAIVDEYNLTSYDPLEAQAIISNIRSPHRALMDLARESHDSTALNKWETRSPYAEGLWQKLVGI